ncbi:MAG: Sec-independent protein translocase protein TatB [Pseudomonadota bacterium]|nr:Sec-independent protein translocase protein TatB [Pseudomonadota bacterium]
MFDIGALELLVIVIVAVVVIGPKDMPLAMRTVGRWVGKVRRVSAHFRSGIDAMVREAELEDMEKQWKARNEEIMRNSADPSDPATAMTGPPPGAAKDVSAPVKDGSVAEAVDPPAKPAEKG